MDNLNNEDAATVCVTSTIQAPTGGHRPGRDHLEDGGPLPLAVRDDTPIDRGV